MRSGTRDGMRGVRSNIRYGVVVVVLLLLLYGRSTTTGMIYCILLLG